jgi:hypothetical protein
MIINPPVIITPSLDPGLQIEDVILSVSPASMRDGRIQWSVQIYRLGSEPMYAESAVINTAPQYADDATGARAALGSLLSFLEADAERYQGTMRDRTDVPADGDGWLFNAETAEWAYGVSDELAMVRDEIEGGL